MLKFCRKLSNNKYLTIFFVFPTFEMEYTSNQFSTHNHFLIKGKGVEKKVEYHLKEKGLITNIFKHLDYERGASMYVS